MVVGIVVVVVKEAKTQKSIKLNSKNTKGLLVVVEVVVGVAKT